MFAVALVWWSEAVRARVEEASDWQGNHTKRDVIRATRELAGFGGEADLLGFGPGLRGSRDETRN